MDNYLKAILTLGGADNVRVMSKALAERLQVAPASVTNMLQKLAAADQPLVAYERHRGVALSDSGKRRALEVLRHHRLLETFLYKVLDYPLEEVHDDAERLEHFISERFEERIAAKLGHPALDPHGHAIPTMSGEMTARSSMCLADIVCDGIFVVESVNDRDPAHLRVLEASGMTPGAQVRVSSSAGGFSVSVAGSGEAFAVSREVAGDVRLVEAAGR